MLPHPTLIFLQNAKKKNKKRVVTRLEPVASTRAAPVSVFGGESQN